MSFESFLCVGFRGDPGTKLRVSLWNQRLAVRFRSLCTFGKDSDQNGYEGVTCVREAELRNTLRDPSGFVCGV